MRETSAANAPSIDQRIRTLVVDDEKLARAGLCAMLAVDADLIVDECASGREAIAIVRSGQIDLALLDVQMPKVGGFDIITAIGADRMPVVVFVTAYDAYAIDAFEACALDYVLKPVRDVRLAQAIARAKEAVRQRRLGQVSEQLITLLARQPATPGKSKLLNEPIATPTANDALPLQRVLFRSGAVSYYVDTDDIDWIESDSYYARIWTGVRSHLLRQSLNQLETSLDRDRFVRVHRSAIVNVTRVSEVRQIGIGKYSVVLQDGTRVPLSRDRRTHLHGALRGRSR